MPGRGPRRPLQVRDHVAQRRLPRREGRSDGALRRGAAAHRLGRVEASTTRWNDDDWMATRAERNALGAPMSVYEVHLGSWRRSPDDPRKVLGYRDLAPLLVEHVTRLGFTHVELLPIMEHPFYGSWGYQTTGYFAPTRRYGDPEDFMWLVDQLHQAGHRRDPRLGAVALPERRARARLLRRHAPVRALGPAPGLPPRLEERDLQLRPQRGAQLPHVERLALARRLPRRRHPRRRRRLDALPRLLAARGRVDPERVRRPREPRTRSSSCSG